MEELRLIKPEEATGEAKKVYDEIIETQGMKWLVPLWGFFAHVPELLRFHWELLKVLEIEEGHVPRDIMNSISMVCAVAADCARCVNYHQTTLVERLGISPEKAEKLRNFEESDIPEEEKIIYRFAKKVAFGEQLTPEEYMAVRKLGYGDAAIVEIVTVALFESAMARHGVVLAQHEDSLDWPAEYTPSEFYKAHADK